MANSNQINKTRRSPRLAAMNCEQDGMKSTKPSNETRSYENSKKRKNATSRSSTKKAAKVKKSKDVDDNASDAIGRNQLVKPSDEVLPRTRERQLLMEQSGLKWVMGVDEAGRGPLAGPVVAAAAIVPSDIVGIVDSKRITNEAVREFLYEEIVKSKEVRWCVAIVDAERIDEVNILQATMQAMKMAATSLVDETGNKLERRLAASIEEAGCYVVCSENAMIEKKSSPSKEGSSSNGCSTSTEYHCLIDGNRVPKDMPCSVESIVKGDSKEYSIAAASILAKVTRDRLMHGYDELYPQYDLGKNKGYPTKAHMSSVRKHGASKIHRRTFAPLKHMEFDESGRVITDDSELKG